MNDKEQIESLYRRLIAAWNSRDAAAFAAQFTSDGQIIGFDGSAVNGSSEIQSHLAQIFAHHQTPPYVSIIRDVRFPTTDAGILSAAAGMAPPGKSVLNPALNAVQSLVAVRREGLWLVALFQNTPAAFHGRPELSEKLTSELQAAQDQAKEKHS